MKGLNDIDMDIVLKNLDIERLRKDGIKLLELDIEDLIKDDNILNLIVTVNKICSVYTILDLFKTLNKDQIIELWEKINKEEVDE